jgi:hypothetical protein
MLPDACLRCFYAMRSASLRVMLKEHHFEMKMRRVGFILASQPHENQRSLNDITVPDKVTRRAMTSRQALYTI